MEKQVSVVIGSYNRKEFLKRAISSARREVKDTTHEIIVIDGGSTDGSIRWLAKQKDVLTIVQHNRGRWQGKPVDSRSWGYFMNLGFKCAGGKYVLMISDDCLLVPNAVRNGIRKFEELLAKGLKIGGIAFYWRNWPEQTSYWVGLTLGDMMFVNHGLFLRAALEDVGWAEEEIYHFYHADGDLCLKLWAAGYEIVESSGSFVEHFSHANIDVRQSNIEKQQHDWQTYLTRWEGVFYDPEKNNVGGWKTLPYSDPNNTVALFPQIHHPWSTIRRRLSSLLPSNLFSR